MSDARHEPPAPRQILTVVVPARPDHPVWAGLLAVSSRVFSDAIGGGLTDDGRGVVVPHRVLTFLPPGPPL
jgi:hypothetical protein